MKRVGLLAVALTLAFCSFAFADRPPFIPSNRCEAQCLVDFRACDRICSVNPCLVSCEFLADICLQACSAS